MKKVFLLLGLLFVVVLTANAYAYTVPTSTAFSATQPQIYTAMHFNQSQAPFVVSGTLVVPFEYAWYTINGSNYNSVTKSDVFSFPIALYFNCLTLKHATAPNVYIQNNGTYCKSLAQLAFTNKLNSVVSKQYAQIQTDKTAAQGNPFILGDFTV